MNQTNKTLTIWLSMMILSVISVYIGNQGPTTPVVSSGTLTIDQAIDIYQNSTGNTLQTPVYYTDSEHIFFKGKPLLLGLCATHNKTGEKHIIINIDRWNESSDSKRVYVLYHEIGHCDFGLEHTEDEHDLMYHAVGEPQLESFQINFHKINKMMGQM